MRYSVSYDLREPRRDYQSLYNELIRLNAKRVLESEWVLRHNKTSASSLRDHLMRYIDTNDRLLVLIIQDWASYNAMADINLV